MVVPLVSGLETGTMDQRLHVRVFERATTGIFCGKLRFNLHTMLSALFDDPIYIMNLVGSVGETSNQFLLCDSRLCMLLRSSSATNGYYHHSNLTGMAQMSTPFSTTPNCTGVGGECKLGANMTRVGLLESRRAYTE